MTIDWSVLGYNDIKINGQTVSGNTGSKTFTNITERTVFTLVATNDNGSTCRQTVIVDCELPPTPVCTLTPKTQTIYAGERATLNWTTNNANSVSLTGFGSVNENDSVTTGPLFQNTTYKLTATRSGTTAPKTVHCTAHVIVVDKPVPDPVCTLGPKNQTIAYGEKANLTWTTDNATTVTITEFGNVSSDDSRQTQSLFSNKTYVLKASGNGKEVECEAYVHVLPPVPPTCDMFSISADNIVIGDSATLSWQSSNANSASISNVGAVPVVGTTEVTPNTDTTYLLTLTGINNQKVSCDVSIKVSPDPVPVCELFTATPEELNFGGGNVDLKWKVTDAVDVTISSIGAVSLEGDRSVNITNSTTFVLTAKDSSGDEVNCEAAVVVKDALAPSCDMFDADPATITVGEASTLSWSSTNATRAMINNAVGQVPVDGSVDVRPNDDLTYKLTLFGEDDSSVDCFVPVKVVDAPVLSCDLFDSTPDSITVGETVTLNWASTNAVSASIDNGIGAVVVDGSRSVTPLVSTTYLLTLTDQDNKTIDCPASVTVSEAPVLSCDLFTANPETINVGGSATLNWASTNAVSASINNGIGAVAVDGSRSVSPSNSTNYVLTLTDQDNKSIDCSAPVTVSQVPVLSCDLITATPGTIMVNGTSTLNWASTNAVSASFNNGIGAVAVDGSRLVSPSISTNYVLTLTDVKGNIRDCSVPIVVSDDPAPVCKLFTATPTQLGVNGGDVVLNWEVLNATDVSISPSIGPVSLVDSQTVGVTQSVTYTLTAKDDNGDEVSCDAAIAVADPVPLFTCENNVDFSVTDSTITRGDSVTLNWDTTDVDTVSISEINATTLTGSQGVSPSNDTTYILTATQGNETINCPTSVNVSTGGGGGGGSSPRCELDISDKTIERGEEITLTWDTSRAGDVTLIDNRGEIIFTTEDRLSRDKGELFDGSIDLSPVRDTEYTLIVERGSRDRECSVEVEVEDTITVLQTRDQQPLVAGISLSQVPYTGFEAGPVMTMLFYLLLIAWSLYFTYLIFMRKQSATNVNAPIMDTAALSDVNQNTMHKAETVRPDVFAASTTVEVPQVLPANLPVSEKVVGYENEVLQQQSYTSDPFQGLATELENRANSQRALLSSDAVHYFINTTEGNVERNEAIDQVIAEAKTNYPLEDGWIVINEDRMRNLCEACKLSGDREVKVEASKLVNEGSSSLAEAVVTGNILAAYEMIGSRPMFSLADAATDLDAVYRMRKGETVSISNLLMTETASLSDGQIKNMIAALTGALDGTYTDEASAVKMAIMKAVKEVG